MFSLTNSSGLAVDIFRGLAGRPSTTARRNRVAFAKYVRNSDRAEQLRSADRQRFYGDDRCDCGSDYCALVNELSDALRSL